MRSDQAKTGTGSVRQRFRPRVLIAGLLCFGLIAGGNFLTGSLRPWTTALVQHCIDRTQPDAWFKNICGFDINLSYCVATDTGKDYNNCPVIRLLPGEGASPARGETLEVDAYAKRRIWACKAPFQPVMKPSLSNRNIQQTACGPALRRGG